MDWLEIIFWTSVGFIGYAYLGYPLLLMLLGVVRNRKGTVPADCVFYHHGL